ncbi:MAG: ABC-F family ATP-binding cassette domain-containing protein [Reyranella sp.]|uniref:ABC-F family ATP-binding cassette domain-containing protein n=1 Tax=Reyranella sp. TaxID=1929291 RepID=UPI001ACE7643|nr:ABC-F family ATP-binding cassette domain-containing protein [Reyranella sp.]MBN9089965.1 ABC-F family ATP-binding cassette domain-containing protein [Reyranella sp.]
MPARQAVLGMEHASFFYGSAKIFEDVSFLLDDARTALVGENGAGKSTLLKCLTGALELNGGQIVRSRGLRVGSVPQDVPAELAPLTVREVLQRSLERIGQGDDWWRLDVLAEEIGIAPETLDREFGELSGGWQRLMLIAGAAKLEEPDILILDEPTNHLDLANINTLERWLTEEFEIPMLIVSHDREILDRVTQRTLFLRSDGVHAFKTRFSVAREELLRRDATAAARAKLEEKEIRRLEQAAARYKVWAVKNPDLNKRKNAVGTRIARIEADRTQTYVARDRRLELSDGDIDARVALRLANLDVKTPDSRKLIAIDRLTVAAGDRIALLGVNGSGKSTLLSALAAAYDPEREHYDGQAPVRFNPSCRLVYFDQTMQDLPVKSTILDFAATEGTTEKEAIRMLAQAGFAFARLKEPIGVLSHGERARLVFLKMKLLRPNFYLLDEPTNHLDIEGQEDLEEQLERSDVSCLFVSHDRFFTRTAATRFLEIRRGRLVEIDDPDAFFDAQA